MEFFKNGFEDVLEHLIVNAFHIQYIELFDGKLKKVRVKTDFYPGFPTDMQPQMLTLLTKAEGTSIMTENVWDNRFKYVEELRRMGANVSVDGRMAVVEGGSKLMG